ncbi:MAG: TetR/AcrR family transcriptional regulator [Clostridiales bacterium]|nr:TetR/AcrR family transcriptional regulator [Clostridiales bacterium]
MNKSESKYFNTALLMNEALIDLLKTKDLEYITVKEICEKAGVNRSTFYLHYETILDLADEALDNVTKRFLSYFKHKEGEITGKISSCELSDLVFITKDYLRPYLQFIYDNKNIYRANFRNPNNMQVDKQYELLKTYILEPVFNRFEIPNKFHKYFTAYYIEGISAIIKEWLNTNCSDSIDDIIRVIEECVRPSDGTIGKHYEE